MQIRRHGRGYLFKCAKLPNRGTAGSAGLDLYCVEAAVLLPHIVTKFFTDIGVQCPLGHYGHVCPRSSLALKGVIILAGVIDSDYQGSTQVVLENTSDELATVEKHDRIAQLLVKPVHMGTVIEVPRPQQITQRGEGGFGSTDVSGAKVWV
uniref:Deoxyuridine 5'-triphosphate nucleotidohydrolase n=1 Tax=Paramormyrops kingsleyae TaxID=1676925 RepID=A0A3B3RZ77_9TELE